MLNISSNQVVISFFLIKIAFDLKITGTTKRSRFVIGCEDSIEDRYENSMDNKSEEEKLLDNP